MAVLINLLFKLTVIAWLVCCVITSDLPKATVRQGTLVGSYRQSTNGRTFSAFTGIPYAEPPIGELRFKPPVPAKPWKGIFKATEPHAICIQINAVLEDFEVKGSEDCLYLNVYTPEVDNKRRPVMFFIHCGGWMWGSGNSNTHGPEHLLDKDIILVTVNYRLGSLGFLSTGDEVVPGNNGLKDQSLALRWVYENIEHFGGDPNQIIVSGQSAGAASAHYHMLSPLSKGLIKGAIASSGSAFAPWATTVGSQNAENSLKLANFFNCPTSSSTEMVQCLQNIDARAIGDHEKTLYEFIYMPIIPYKPVIEPDIEGAFITEHPIEIIKSGKAANVPLLIGATSEDGLLVTAAIYKDAATVEDLTKRFDTLMPMVLFFDHHISDKFHEEISKIKEFYFNNSTFNFDQLTQIITDRWFGVHSDMAARLHQQYGTAPVYNYLFQYRGSRSFSELFGNSDEYGVCHCDDLLYLFTSEMLDNYQANPSDKDMTDLMVNLYANFVQTGNPTPVEADPQIPITWNPLTADRLECLIIKKANNLTLERDPFSKRIKFWEQLFTNDHKSTSNREEL